MKLRCVVVVAVVLGLLFPGTAFATEECRADNSSFSVSPPIKDITIDPNAVIDDSFKIMNFSTASRTFKVYASPFSETENGKDFTTETGYTQLKNWLLFASDEEYLQGLEVTVPGCESREIKIKITVPESIPSGGQYAAVFTESSNDNGEKTSISSSSRIGMLIYGQVRGGDTTLNITHSNPKIALNNGKIKVSCFGANNGNIDGTIESHVIVTSFFGGTVYDNTTNISLLPGVSNREIVDIWEKTPAFGVFTVEYIITTSSGATETLTKTIIVVPIPVMLLIVALLAMIPFKLAQIKKKMKQN